MMSDYYRHRSEHYARRFGLSLSESVQGWSCGGVTDTVDMASLGAVLASEGEVLGRGLIEWVASL